MSFLDSAASAFASAIDALKGSPLTLALVIMNFGMLGLLYFESSNGLEQRRRIAEQVLNMTKENNQLLANCVSQEVVKELLKARQ